MANCIVIMIALRPSVTADSFESYFREAIQKIREKEQVAEAVTFSLHQPVEVGQEFVWVTRFAEDELSRVSRAAWPFLILSMHGMLAEIQIRFATDVAAASSSVLTAQALVQQWNDRFGRFTKLSLGA